MLYQVHRVTKAEQTPDGEWVVTEATPLGKPKALPPGMTIEQWAVIGMRDYHATVFPFGAHYMEEKFKSVLWLTIKWGYEEAGKPDLIVTEVILTPAEEFRLAKFASRLVYGKVEPPQVGHARSEYAVIHTGRFGGWVYECHDGSWYAADSKRDAVAGPYPNREMAGVAVMADHVGALVMLVEA